MSEPGSSFDDRPLAARRVASGRIGRILMAYVLAVAAVAAVRTLGLVIEESWTRGFDRLIAVNGWASLVVVPAMTALIVFVAAAPLVTAFLVAAEARALRAPWIYALAGLAIALLTRALIALPFGLPLPSFGLFALEAAAGGVGAWVYWLVAIRSAPPPPPSDPWAEI